MVKLFSGNNFYPYGGYEDFKGNFEDVESAKDFAEKQENNMDYLWAHIVDGDKIIVHGTTKIDYHLKEYTWEWDCP